MYLFIGMLIYTRSVNVRRVVQDQWRNNGVAAARGVTQPSGAPRHFLNAASNILSSLIESSLK